MKKLFAIRDTKANEAIVSDQYFELKADAKKTRNQLNAADKKKDENQISTRYQVTRGPDHEDGISRSAMWRQAPQRISKRRQKKMYNE